MSIENNKDLKNLIVALKQEQQWCESNLENNLSEDYKFGFIKGIKQSILIIKKHISD